MRRRISFTLVEVLIVLIVLAILAAIGIPIYQNTVEKIKEDICTARQEALLEAIKIYDMENDALPDTIARAWDGYGDRARAIVWERRRRERDYIYLAYISFQDFKLFLADIFSPNLLYAHDPPGRHPHLSESIADRSILNCPADTNGLPSYGINSEVINLRWRDIPPDTTVIADSDTGTFGIADGLVGGVANRHRGGTIVATRRGTIEYRGRGGEIRTLRRRGGGGEEASDDAAGGGGGAI